MSGKNQKATAKPKKPNKSRRNQDEFYQYLPGAYIDSYEMFPTEDEEDQASEAAIRRRMLLQLAALVGLLIAQFVLFGVLLQSTMNLG
jgi:hypothetical protein